MRVLVAHNRYDSSQPSGENVVVDAEVAALRAAGVEVVEYFTSSDELFTDSGSMRKSKIPLAAFGPIYSPRGGPRFRRLLDETAPDVVHLHNPYPLLSPALIRTAKAARIPVVQTLHNYRRVCARATFFREGSECRLCESRTGTLSAVRHACYRGSRVQSVPMAVGLAVHRGTWAMLDRHVVLSPYMSSWLQRQGIPRERIMLRPTAVPDPGPSATPGQRVCFVGRLDEEKGVEFLVRAWRRSRLPSSGWELDVVGDGPLLPHLRSLCEKEPSIHLHGRLDAGQVARTMDLASCIALPSACLEGFPRVVSEAFSHGRPVLALRNDNLETVVGDAGWLAEDENEFAAALDHLRAADDVALASVRARARYDEELREDRALERLIGMYQEIR